MKGGFPVVCYTPAGPADLPRLREIFLLCFGQAAAAEMELVFSRCGDALWCAKAEGRPAAMLAAMPVTLALPQGEYKARYFYGVATHPEARRQGLCENLLAACCRWMTGQGEAAALLRPDSEKNRSYYRKNSFADCSTAGTGCYRPKGGAAAELTPADPAEYDRLRRKFAPWGLQWGREGLFLQKGWMRLYGGDLWLLGQPADPWGCAAVSREGESPLLRELLCDKADAEKALEGLCRTLQAPELGLALPQPGPVEGLPARPMMMIRKTGEIDLPEAIYTPLAMD